METKTWVVIGQLLWAISPVLIFLSLLLSLCRDVKSQENGAIKEISLDYWWFDLFTVLYVFVTMFIVTSSWFWAIFASIIMVIIFFNAFIIRQTFGSITIVINEEGEKRAVLWVFLGIILLIKSIIDAIHRYDEEDSQEEW